MDRLPADNKSVDMIICQEGIEHFSDQIKSLGELNRILKEYGKLLITTPNYSNIQSKLSFLLAESERFFAMMPPNEMDSIWTSKQPVTDEIYYYGHIFLIGIQKLRVLAKLLGFRIKKIHDARVKTTPLALFPFIYPWVYLANKMAYNYSLKKAIRKGIGLDRAKAVYGEQLKINLNHKLLISSHIFVEFEKEEDCDKVGNRLTGVHQDFCEHAT